MTARQAVKGAALLLACSALVCAGSPTAGAAEGTAACKDGGFLDYVDADTGSAYANQGRCVSFVARGGTLVPVQTATLSVIELDDGSPGSYWALISATGLEPFATVELHLQYLSGRTSTARGLQADENGAYAMSIGGQCDIPEGVLAGEVTLLSGTTVLTAPVPVFTQCPS